MARISSFFSRASMNWLERPHKPSMPPWEFDEEQHPLPMALFRRPLAHCNHVQISPTTDRSHLLLPRILECQSRTNFEHHGVRYAPFPADGVVHCYSMPPSRPCVANQTSQQGIPPHPMAALTPTMTLPDRRRLSGPPTPPKAPTQTQPQTTMEEMGEFLPIPPLLIN